MASRLLRTCVAVLLGASGALMYAASWQRWSGACPWGVDESAACTARQDHLYDFLPPIDPWQPVGDAAQLAGWSLLALAFAFLLLPWALTGRRPGAWSAVAQVAAVAGTGAVGAAALQSGQMGRVVEIPGSPLAVYCWLLVPPALLVAWAVAAHGWARAAACVLVLGTPAVAALSYALGSYDARPWWEAMSGTLTMLGAACLLVDAVIGGRSRRPRVEQPAEKSLSAP